MARKRWRRALSVTLLAAHMKTLARHAESARVESGPLPGADDERTSTNRQTWANIVNVYVGLGLLSTPYALAECGWSGLIGLGAGERAGGVVRWGPWARSCGGVCRGVIAPRVCQPIVCPLHPSSASAAFLACLYTGQTIVHAFNAAADKDGSCSYPGVGAAAFGGLGEWAVIVFVFLEFFGGLAMCIVFYWTNLDHLLPAGWDEFTIAMVSVVVVLPTVWVKRFSDLSFISLLGFGSSLLITAVTTGVAAYGEAVSARVPARGVARATRACGALTPVCAPAPPFARHDACRRSTLRLPTKRRRRFSPVSSALASGWASS